MAAAIVASENSKPDRYSRRGDVGGAPDNSRLTKKQQSFRLPVHLAAKIEALCEIYPGKSKTMIVGNLLATALHEVIANLPYEEGRQVDNHPEPGPIYEMDGLAASFRKLANKHYQALDRALGNKAPTAIYPGEFPVAER
jgi:hypothetical protein